MNALAAYLVYLLGLSLVAVGGATAILPELHAFAVTQRHVVSSAEFARLFAIAQAAPGPNVLIVAVLGWKIAGVPGAVASLIAMVAPSSVVAYAVSRAWARYETTRIVRLLAAVLAPLAVGLVSGSGLAIAATIGPTRLGIALVIAATMLAWRSKISPLLVLAAGALAGASGLV